ncbi:MAG TPA: hypothetical protein VMP12_08620 [Candidatus Sulfotelmatobacter sp.]|nr:hypothetical protein [Candidatus Sulfotelmatobacter sp.]
MIFALSGKAFMIEADRSERLMAAGDVGFFPAGTSCLFRVDDHFGKVAVLGETMTARRRTQTLEKTRPVGIPVFGCSSHRKDSHGRCAFDSDPHQAVFDFPPPALGYPPTSRRELKPS